MSRANRRQTPSSSRGRDQNDLPYHQIGQVIAEFLSSLGERQYRGLGSPGRSYGGPAYPDYLDPQHLLRRNFPNADDGPGPQALRPTASHNRHTRTNAAGYGKQGEPIGKAMKKLFKVLEDAEAAYQKHQGDFDSDVDSIKQYAKATLLVDLWRRKFTGEKVEVAGEDSTEQPEDFSETHNTMKQRLAAAIGTALLATAGPDRGPGAAIRHENVTRLQDKVEAANMCIVDVMEKLPREREYCVALLNELEVLRHMIDPDSETNKKLYQGGAGDGKGDSEEDEQGRGDWQD